MKVVLLTVCDQDMHPGFVRLRLSCARHGLPLVGRHVPVWRGTWDKVEAVRDFLPAMRRAGATHACLVDALDVVAQGGRDRLYEAAGPGCLFSAEAWCWPLPHLEPLYPPSPTRWRFLNSGGYLAEIDYLGDYLLAGADAGLTPDQTAGSDGLRFEDQAWFSHKFLADRANCRLDVRCKVFQTLGSGVVTADRHWSETFDIADGRVRNRETGTVPLFLHGNGRGDMSWIPEA